MLHLRAGRLTRPLSAATVESSGQDHGIVPKRVGGRVDQRDHAVLLFKLVQAPEFRCHRAIARSGYYTAGETRG